MSLPTPGIRVIAYPLNPISGPFLPFSGCELWSCTGLRSYTFQALALSQELGHTVCGKVL